MRSDPHPVARSTSVLVVDVGSSHTKLALAAGDQLHRLDCFASAPRTGAVWERELHQVLARHGVALTDLGQVAAASVVPRLARLLREMSRRYGTGLPFRFVTADHAPIPIDYEPATDLGADRIANAVGALETWGAPVIVVDVGTAITCDVVSSDGRFVGGAIAPGLAASLRGLVGGAPVLAPAAARALDGDRDGDGNGAVIGRSTRGCLQVGVVHGAAALVDGLARRYRQVVGPCPVVATGGGATTIVRYSDTITAVEPDLTLRGIYLGAMDQDPNPV